MIRVGTAGFSYRDWDGVVYPDPRPSGFSPLAYLAGFFGCLEINTTFYRVPTADAVRKWTDGVTAIKDFRFTFKLYRGLTHGAEDDRLPPFLEALGPCREAGRLGAILLQFPFYFRNTRDNRSRLSILARGLEGWPCSIEIRDRSWLSDPALDFLRRLRFSVCDIDICQAKDSVQPGCWTSGPIGYVRLHGRNRKAWFDRNAHRDQKYDYLYSAVELEEWVARIRKIAAQTDSTYVITNNHFGGQAVANAFQLARALTDGAPEPPPQLVRRFPELR